MSFSLFQCIFRVRLFIVQLTAHYFIGVARRIVWRGVAGFCTRRRGLPRRRVKRQQAVEAMPTVATQTGWSWLSDLKAVEALVGSSGMETCNFSFNSHIGESISCLALNCT